MNLKAFIRLLKTAPALVPALALIDLVLWLVDWVAILTTPAYRKPASLVIIRLDVLGDYLMFRNYLRQIRQSERFQNHTITLCGNVALRSIAETFDREVIDQFIWVDIYQLSTNPVYRFRTVRQLRRQGFSAVFCPAYSRVLVLDDFLAWATGAPERVGCQTDYVNIKRWEAFLGDRLYTRLLDLETGLVFELQRNRQIVSAFLNAPIPIEVPTLDLAYATPTDVPPKYAVFSLGAGQEFRVWPARRFAAVARYIQQALPDYHILLTGAPNEKIYAEAFLAELASRERIVDRTGVLSLPQLIYVLSKAELLIANETGTVHIAAALQTPTLVISQGKTLVRWHPYPATLTHCVHHLYPPYLEENRHRLLELAPGFNPESPFSIEEISVERVIDQVRQHLAPDTLITHCKP